MNAAMRRSTYTISPPLPRRTAMQRKRTAPCEQTTLVTTE